MRNPPPIVRDLNELRLINYKLYLCKSISNAEYKKNLNVIINSLSFKLDLNDKQSTLLHNTVSRNLCVTKLRLCLMMLSPNLN